MRSCICGALATLAFVCGLGAVMAQEQKPPAPAAAAAPPPMNIVPAPARATSAAARDRLPLELVRSMHALQDQLVLGNFAAEAALPKLSARIAAQMLAAPPEIWHDPKNARAVVSYVLSGGQLRVARKILEFGTVPDRERRLLEGAVAYVEGQEGRARQLLLGIDARRIPGPLGGHLALVQAALAKKDEAVKAKHALDTARLLAPGTLMEEAALRREIVLVNDVADIDKFILLASQYERRFRNSIYADNFRQRFAASLLRLGLLSDAEHFARLDGLLRDIQSDPERLNIYLLVAQAAVVSGNLSVAHIAAARAMTLAKAGSPQSTRALLYEGATQILTNHVDEGVAQLNSIDLAHLPKRDAELAHAVLAIAHRIQGWPEASQPETTSVQGVPAAQTPEHKAAALIDIAQKALADTDGLVGK